MILQKVLRGQRRAHGPPLQRGLDMPNEPGVEIRAEYSFRRGFAHGAWWAVCAMNGGASLDELVAWFDEVDEWRNPNRRTRVQHPPIPPRMRAP